MPSAATPAIASPAPAAAASRKPRTDGVEARARLLHTALKLFAQKGFAKTSTREIARAAGTNLAAIAYYFGDKTGLYSACGMTAPKSMFPAPTSANWMLPVNAW